MSDEPRKFKTITFSVVISAESNRRLTEAAKASGHSKRIEAMIRLAHHLKHVPVVEERYWEILAEEKKI